MPHRAASSPARARSLRFRLWEPEVTASAASPSTSAATRATRELSTPPEKATTTRPQAPMRTFNASYLAARASFTAD